MNWIMHFEVNIIPKFLILGSLRINHIFKYNKSYEKSKIHKSLQ
jgi:hypothetical protein